MQLMRAACLQSTRLQLAMQRREAHPTMESLDSLAAIDREIEHFVNSIAPPDSGADSNVAFDDNNPLRDLETLIALQKMSLATEKMALVSGNSGPLFRTGGMSEAPAARSPAVPPVMPNMNVSRSEYQASGKLAHVTMIAATLLLVAAAIGWLMMQG